MKLGVHYIDFLPGAPERLGPTLAATAKAAENAGVEVFTLADHFFQIGDVAEEEDLFAQLMIAAEGLGERAVRAVADHD